MQLSFAFRPQNRYEMLVSLTYFCLIFVNWIPEIASVSSLLFLIILLLCMLFWFINVIQNKVILKSEFICITMILFILLNNYLIISINGLVELTDWIRSAIFLLTWFIFLFFLRFNSKIRPEYFVTSLITSGMIWVFLNLFRADISIIDIFKGGGRLTYTNPNFILPYPLFLTLITLLLIKPSHLRRVLLVFFSIVTIATGYKAHIIILSLGIVFYSLKSGLKITLLGLAILFPIIFYMLTSNSYINQRLSQIGGESDQLRIVEWESAIKIFERNPLFGSGLGIEFDIGSGWEGMESSRSYIHNSMMYFVSTLGIVNTFLILAFFLSLIFSVKSRWSLKLILFLLLLSTLSAASYKLIHFNFMIMSLCFLLLSHYSYSRNINGPHNTA